MTQIVVPPQGSKKSKIVIVGESPGRTEELTKTPFSGGAGRILDGMLRDAGIRRDECYLTNVCKIRPPGISFLTSGMGKFLLRS